MFGDAADALADSLDPNFARDEVLAPTGCAVAVRNISFDVHEGETFVIIVLSGSGKSTVVRRLSRLIEPTRGIIRIDGQDLLEVNRQQLRDVRRYKMGMVFQPFGNFPHKGVLDNVVYGLRIQGADKTAQRQLAPKVIELVGLSGWEDRFPRQLIGLRQLMRKTLVFITHDFLEAFKVGDRVALVKDGEFVQMGTPEDSSPAPSMTMSATLPWTSRAPRFLLHVR